MLVFIIVNDGAYGKEKIPGTISEVKVNNINVYKDKEVAVPRSVIHGADECHKVKDVLIENVFVNGNKISDYEKYVTTGDFTENITIR